MVRMIKRNLIALSGKSLDICLREQRPHWFLHNTEMCTK